MSWKSFERRLAKAFQEERTPLSGGNSKMTRSDTLSDKIFFEAKQRAKFFVWSLWEEVKELAYKEAKTPVLALHQKKKKGYLLVVHTSHLDEFVDYYLHVRKTINGEGMNQ